MKKYWYIKWLFALAIAIEFACGAILHVLGDTQGVAFVIIILGATLYHAVKVEMIIEERRENAVREE